MVHAPYGGYAVPHAFPTCYSTCHGVSCMGHCPPPPDGLTKIQKSPDAENLMIQILEAARGN